MTKTERAGLRQGDRVAIIAGSGRLPQNVADSLAASGTPPYLILVRGEATACSALAEYAHDTIEVEEVGRLFGLLKARKITHVVLAGGIGRRPPWWTLRLGFGLLASLPKALAGLARGDDGLLGLLARELEARGMTVIGAHEIAPDLLAVEGPMGDMAPTRADRRDLDAAYAAARAIGALDIGQAAVAIGGRAIALEGIEGTDGLLERTRALRGHGRIAGRTRGVLVKCAKPGQDLRADMPAIGPATVEGAHAAGLAGIGVEAGRTLVLDFAEVVKRADALGLFVVGLPGHRKP